MEQLSFEDDSVIQMTKFCFQSNSIDEKKTWLNFSWNTNNGLSQNNSIENTGTIKVQVLFSIRFEDFV